MRMGRPIIARLCKTHSTPGLPSFLMPIVENYRENQIGKNFIFLLVHGPKQELNFSSPQWLATSMMKNKEEVFDFGHVQLAWDCQVESRQYRSASGFTGETEGQVLHMIQEGWGATAAFATFADGQFEDPWTVHVRSKRAQRQGRFTGIAIPVSELECKSFLKTFWNLIQSGDDRRFSLYSGGKYPEESFSGFNCTSFAHHLLLQLNLEKKFFHRLFSPAKTRVHIPFRYMGWRESVPKKVYFTAEIQRQVRGTGRVSAAISPLEFGSWERWLSHQPGNHIIFL